MEERAGIDSMAQGTVVPGGIKILASAASIRITRKRYLELTDIGDTLIENALSLGVKKTEGCHLFGIVTKLWELD